MDIKDFRHIKNFPGTEGNDFDVVLRRYAKIQDWPAWLFAFLLLVLAWISSPFDWLNSLGLFTFYLTDWLLLAQLPARGKSFGPPRPVSLILAVMRLPFAFLPSPINWALQFIGTALVIYGFWVEPHRIKITHQRLQSSKLPAGETLRVLHLGDLHIERITARERQLQALIKDLKPDLILFSGDVLNLSFTQDPLAIQQARQIMSEWQAACGTFLVTGSEAVDLEHVFPNLMKDLPVTWLHNRVVEINKGSLSLDLIGLYCSHRPFLDEPELKKILPSDPNRFKILLYHSPDLAPNAAQLGIDLQLSGHTHGGQICLPLIGPLFTASLYGRTFRSGRYQIGGLNLYITRGIGMEGMAAPRVRLLCPPEIILWEISGEGVK